MQCFVPIGSFRFEFTSHWFLCLITFSYRNNPALGDAHSLEVEMALMRHTMRDKESDIALIQGKVCFIACLVTPRVLTVRVCLQTDTYVMMQDTLFEVWLNQSTDSLRNFK